MLPATVPVVIARVAVVVVRDVEVGGRLGANRYNLSSMAAQLCSQTRETSCRVADHAKTLFRL